MQIYDSNDIVDSACGDLETKFTGIESPQTVQKMLTLVHNSKMIIKMPYSSRGFSPASVFHHHHKNVALGSHSERETEQQHISHTAKNRRCRSLFASLRFFFLSLL
jgi:hypothetical protein